jgi:hypothetical protein
MKPILFLHVAWMRAYKGVTNDTPEGTFRFMREGGGTPHEVLNFRPTNGRCYGYAAVPHGSINIARLGASSDDDFVDNVLVVWTATQRGGGRTIVGWYNRARVFAEPQERPETRETRAVDSPLHYNVVAPAATCHLLSLDERVFSIPQQKNGFPGKSPSFFPEGTSPPKWIESVRRYVAKRQVETVAPNKRKGARATDPKHRAKIEAAAIDRVTEHYRNLRYTVTSFEADNRGWDLEACQGRVMLRLEVKGLSGDAAVVEVTPNEYKAMISRSGHATYRLCIVTDALTAKRARLRIFAYDSDAKVWFSDDLEKLKITERIAANISVVIPLRARQSSR